MGPKPGEAEFDILGKESAKGIVVTLNHGRVGACKMA
jgi:hypothetical protein